ARRQVRGGTSRFQAGGCKCLLELLPGACPGSVAQSLQERDDRVERRALVVGGALPRLHAACLVADRADQLVHEPALADARVTGHMGHAAAPAQCALPRLPQLRELEVAADHRGQTLCGCHLQAADSAGWAENPMNADW